ncbi:MAG: UvrD-helicase domain-containing protein [Chloroflexi bacterium]|nr:UvrD-helicase domain-containing protein [Chloroflexota bacterium]
MVKKMRLAFISYSHTDSDFTLKLYHDLKRNKIPTWVDHIDIPKGKDWDVEIDTILRKEKVSHFLLVLSKSSAKSDNVLDEIDAARERKIEFIIPLLIEDCEPPFRVRRRNRIDFRPNYDAAFESLLKCFEEVETVETAKATDEEILSKAQTPTVEQLQAAHDPNPLVRLVAGPGTGKSFVIEERVHWLLNQGTSERSLYVVSFTRAASRDLRTRIEKYCKLNGHGDILQISVSTLHSLALTVLRKAKALHYPVNPQVMDEWELENIFDAECSLELGRTPNRCKEIRLAYEAFWCTGEWNPPNYPQPDTPITEEERQSFKAFHQPTTRTYSCVLPGEIVYECVKNIRAGIIEPVSLLEMQHFIVDEFQDLNVIDLAFINSVITSGATTYVAGDDDQSLYFFRYAFPAGIQDFMLQYPKATQHTLEICFRCTPKVLASAQNLIKNYSDPKRIPKSLHSFYDSLEEPIQGVVHQWSFQSGISEARAMASSCQELIAQGVEPRSILILISERRILLPTLQKAFSDLGIDVELPVGTRFIDSNWGRYAYALVRLACDKDLEDYVAHRLILGLPKGVGTGTCYSIRRKVVENNLNYLDIFYYDRPNVFSGREMTAINQAHEVCEVVTKWDSKDTISNLAARIASIISIAFKDENAGQSWLDYIDQSQLPSDMNLDELRLYMGTDSDEQQALIMESVYKRLDKEIPEKGFLPQHVRIMTMHGVKGLNAKVVFIPGLEQDIFPSQKRMRSPGLILEAARMLYVAITRARAACILSYASSRMMYNTFEHTRASMFNLYLGGRFERRQTGLSNAEAMEIAQAIQLISSDK